MNTTRTSRPLALIAVIGAADMVGTAGKPKDGRDVGGR